MSYIIEFILFAFLGWIIDSSYCSLIHRKIIISGYFRGIPLCPIYGFGGIVLIHSFAFFIHAPFWLTILVTTFFVVLLEYVGGWVAEQILEEKLWDYSNESFNINGYISAWHSFLWLIGISIAYFLIGDKVSMYISWLNAQVILDTSLQVVLLFLLLVFAAWATIKNKSVRLSKLSEKKFHEFEIMEKKLVRNVTKMMH